MVHAVQYYLSFVRGEDGILSLHHHIQPVKEHALHASSEVLLIPQKHLVKVSHAAHKHPIVDIQLIEPARQLSSKQRTLTPEII